MGKAKKKETIRVKKKPSLLSMIGTVVFTLISIIFVSPIFIVLINSFKGKSYINLETFKLPTEQSFVGLHNYNTAITQYDFIKAVGWTLFITVASVIVILVCCSMAAWYIERVKNKITKLIYLLCVFSMVIPFQMVMFTLSGTADSLHLNTPWGIIIVYLGFGAGLAVFMFCGFVKAIPVEVEEAAIIDGANIFQMFFKVVFPLLKGTTVTVIVLNGMWIWNDYLLPFLVIGNSDGVKTLTLELYFAKLTSGQYGNPWELIFPAVLVTIIPIVILYIFLQKYIVAGVAEGAVKM